MQTCGSRGVGRIFSQHLLENFNGLAGVSLAQVKLTEGGRGPFLGIFVGSDQVLYDGVLYDGVLCDGVVDDDILSNHHRRRRIFFVVLDDTRRRSLGYRLRSRSPQRVQGRLGGGGTGKVEEVVETGRGSRRPDVEKVAARCRENGHRLCDGRLLQDRLDLRHVQDRHVQDRHVQDRLDDRFCRGLGPGLSRLGGGHDRRHGFG